MEAGGLDGHDKYFAVFVNPFLTTGKAIYRVAVTAMMKQRNPGSAWEHT